MSETFFDPFRSKEIKSDPEELVRHAIVEKMICSLGYPKSYLVVERDLASLPHLQNAKNLPNRRVDVACYAKGNFSLQPLLVIECKADRINQKTLDQVLGYNYYIRAAFIGLVGKKQEVIGYFDTKEDKYLFMNSIPTYRELLDAIK